MVITHTITSNSEKRYSLTSSMSFSFLNAWSANPEILRTHLLSTWQQALDRWPCDWNTDLCR